MPARDWPESSASHILTLSNDSSIQHYTETRNDAVAFLNDSLPALSVLLATSSDSARSKHPSLQDVSTQTQAFLMKVNAENILFANTLSQLADEILRCGSRLAYEVEVLRGDANALQDSFADSLRQDVQNFARLDSRETSSADGAGNERLTEKAHGDEPDFIGQLRMLDQVKSRLEEVMKVFGEAMKWPLSPSELSLTSSLISVSAPKPDSESRSQEERGRDFAKKAKADIIELLDDDKKTPDIEAAARKVGALRSLSAVWKGTSEERARNKFVDSLSKLVEDKARQLEARSSSQLPWGTTALPSSSSRPPIAPARERTGHEIGSGGGGLLRNLQRLRDEIYLD